MNTVPSPAHSRRPMERLAAALPILGSLAIALGLIAVSYGHIYSFAEQAGAKHWEAAILAATVDGALVVALAVIGLAKSRGQEPPKIAKATLIVAVMATGAANLDHGLQYGWRGVAAAVWVPLVAELSYALAMATGRITRSSSVATGHGHAEEDGHHAEEDGHYGQEGAEDDGRRVICTRLVSVAALEATRPPRKPELDLADLRPDICTRPITAAEVLARTSVTTDPTKKTTKKTTATATRRASRPATAKEKAEREALVLDWLTAMDAPADRMDTATGEDVVALLAAHGHGTVSDRTGRRILGDVRAEVANLLPMSVATDSMAA